MQHTTEREPIGAGIVGYTFRKHFRCHISVRSSEKIFFIVYTKIQQRDSNIPIEREREREKERERES